MFVRLYKVNIRQNSFGEEQFYLTEVSINVNQISFMSENIYLKDMLKEGKLNLDLNTRVEFTDLRLNNKEHITVVGSPSVIESKILGSTKTLLRG